MSTYRIAVTGGPCAGKTTVMAALKKSLERDDWAVSVVPEAATILLEAGAQLIGGDDNETLVLQANLFRFQRELETAVQLGVLYEHRHVVLIDRGLMDNKAYVTEWMWGRLLAAIGTTDEKILKRYDAVLHLQSAACGAEEHYKQTEVRRETIEQARALETRTADAWLGHQLWALTMNGGDGFDGKVERAVAACRFMLDKLTNQEGDL